ncbi:MAG: phosphatidylserine decarboxylase [Kiritimatiellia bacterium]|nr:phosphatidylserine decarboxylase [Lentisphaerota bacterium]
MMGLPFAREVVPYLWFAALVFGLPGLVFIYFRHRRVGLGLLAVMVLFGAYMLFFFRDPPRIPPDDPSLVLAGADGKIMGVTRVQDDTHLKTEAVRISIFLSLLDVHINRAPIPGKVTSLGYHPGKRYFTFQEKSSDYNQHSSILIENDRLACLVKQIVGPVARRVVYWLEIDQQLQAGDRIGLMKFGSRLDIFLPAADVTVLVQPGDRVSAGITPVARINPVE